jgi:hypothetical protein
MTITLSAQFIPPSSAVGRCNPPLEHGYDREKDDGEIL